MKKEIDDLSLDIDSIIQATSKGIRKSTLWVYVAKCPDLKINIDISKKD